LVRKGVESKRGGRKRLGAVSTLEIKKETTE